MTKKLQEAKATHSDHAESVEPVNTGSTKRPLDQDVGDHNFDTSAAAPVTVSPFGAVTREQVEAVFTGTQLSEEATTQAMNLFESAVNSRVESIEESLRSHYLQELQEAEQIMAAELTEKVDAYITYVAETFIEENRIAIEAGIRTELAEQVFDSVASIIESYGIDLPTDKVDVAEALAKEVQTLEGRLHESMMESRASAKALAESQRRETVRELSEGMSDVARAKLMTLSEQISTEDLTSFRGQVEILKENVSEKPSATKEVLVEGLIEVPAASTPAPHDVKRQAYLDAARAMAPKN